MEKIDFLFPEKACLLFNRDDCYIFDTFSISFNLSLFHNYDGVTGLFPHEHCSLPTTLEMGKL